MNCILRTYIGQRRPDGSRGMVEVNVSNPDITAADLRHLIRTLDMIAGWFEEDEATIVAGIVGMAEAIRGAKGEP